MGGERLAAEGIDRVARAEDLSVMGFSDVFGRLPTILRALSALQREAARRGPDAAILIDFPDFHAALSRRLGRLGIPLIYYVSPQVWAWRAGRARVIARRARRILTLFRFETEIYKRLGADVVWTGHPIVDDVREGLAAGPASLPRSRPRLALLPGSRRGEILRLWPLLRDAASRLSHARGLEVLALQAPGVPGDHYPGAREAGIRLVGAGSHALLASTDLALVASGTATLETALCGAPMVVVYRTSRMSYAIGRRLVKVPWISLVNIVAGEELVPELLQEQVSPDRLEREAAALLDSPSRQERMKRGYERVARELGPPGASVRAADAVLGALAGSAGTPPRVAAR